METEFVTVKGKKCYVDNDFLDLSEMKIEDISEIKDLEGHIHLKHLNLSCNQIQEITGLEHLTNLQEIVLYNNPIRENEKYLVDIGLKNAQEVVRYCQEKARKSKEGD